MKRLLLLLIPALVFSQKEVNVPTVGSIKDNAGKTTNLIVIDQRSKTDLGTLDFKKQSIHFAFAEPTAAEFFTNWYKKNNKNPKGTQNLVLLLEDLEFRNETENGKDFLKADVRASTFVEKDNQYYFVETVNTTLTPGELPNSPNGIAVAVPLRFSQLIKQSYSTTPAAKAISREDLVNYAAIMRAEMPAFTSANLKDGVYKDYKSFFSQVPDEGYTLVKNKENEVTKAKKGDETLSGWKIYTYVENGKAYRNTAAGFMEMKLDDNGFYVFSNRGTLSPVQMDSTYGMFGLVGAGIGAIATNEQNKKLQKAEKYNIYVDPLSGGFIYQK